jgi:hypothetical protein
VVAVTSQGVMVTYRYADMLCLFVASVANNDRSRSTRRDGIDAAVATMLSSLFSGPYGWRSAEYQVMGEQSRVVNVF